jgi:glucose-1-phosphate cytidylyltransferase
MKVAILCGGLGSRLTEETALKPKPMVEIGGQPILWHIMKIFSARGFNEFVLALGYKGETIKDYFINYHYRARDLTVRLPHGSTEVHGKECEDWTVHLLDTGPTTNTGGRLRQAGTFVGSETFMMTYGDGVADIDVRGLLEFHRSHGKLVTVTAVRPPARFGGIVFDGDRVARFAEKPQVGEGWINGGFFVIEPARWSTSRTTASCGKASRWNAWPLMANSSRIATRDSGIVWTRSATSATSKACGSQVRLPGRCGSEVQSPKSSFVPRPSPLAPRPQSLLA